MSQDWSHLLNQAQETQPAGEDLLETQEYKPCEPAEDLLQTQVYQPAEDYLETQVYKMTALMPPADTGLAGQLKKAAQGHLKATWRKQPKEPLETTQLRPKWKKLRVAGDTGGTTGEEFVE